MKYFILYAVVFLTSINGVAQLKVPSTFSQFFEMENGIMLLNFEKDDDETKAFNKSISVINDKGELQFDYDIDLEGLMEWNAGFEIDGYY